MPDTILFAATNNANRVSADGSTLGIDLDTPIDVSGKSLRVYNASYWNSFANVNGTTYLNNKFEFTYNGATTSITLPAGVYGIADLNEELSQRNINAGNPQDLMVLYADESTSKVTLVVTTALAWSMDFDSPNNTLFKKALGFTGAVATVVDQAYESTNKAALNPYENVIVSCSFAGSKHSIFGSRAGSNVIAVCPLTVRSGALAFYEPLHPLPVVCQPIKELQRFEVWLSDEAGNRLDTVSEPWSVTMVISDSA